MNDNGIRDCERFCPKCKQWKHYSRFRSFTVRHGSVSNKPTIGFRKLCKACEQIERNEELNADRPSQILKRRTTQRARSLGVPFDFVWTNMNWRALLPVFRAMQTPEGLCLDCGHPFRNERDIQIEHLEPPRHSQDWAREHTRNLGLACQSCNNGKGKKPFALWLDEQEDARLANEAHRENLEPGAIVPEQPRLFDP